MQTLGLRDITAYSDYLDRNPSEWSVFDTYCRITISCFYRDKAVFGTIGDKVLQDLAGRAAEEGRDVRCWAIGCASGEEVYTLRILWDCVIARSSSKVGLAVLGIDIDDSVLRRAFAGCYHAGSLKELPKEFNKRCFEALDGQFCVKPEHHRGITFAKQDIRREMPAGPFDLILCRNVVLTYFEPSLQMSLMQQISKRIILGGYLVIGAHEALPADVGGFEPLLTCPKVFQWRGSGAGQW